MAVVSNAEYIWICVAVMAVAVSLVLLYHRREHGRLILQPPVQDLRTGDTADELSEDVVRTPIDGQSQHTQLVLLDEQDFARLVRGEALKLPVASLTGSALIQLRGTTYPRLLDIVEHQWMTQNRSKAV